MGIKIEPLTFKKKKKNEVNTRMSLITILVPRQVLEIIDDLVSDELFSSRAEAIRTSIILMLIELKKLEKNNNFIEQLVKRR